MLYTNVVNDEERSEKKRAYAREYMREWRKRNPEAIKEITARKYAKNGQRYRDENRAKLDALKSAPCFDCGVSYPPYVMQFDHRDPAEKSFQLNIQAFHRSWKSLQIELGKCDLVCANCHAERTYQYVLKHGGWNRKRVA